MKAGAASPGFSMISFADDTKGGNMSKIHTRKQSLPSIRGVNQRSLSLLIDEPSMLTPLARRGGGF